MRMILLAGVALLGIGIGSAYAVDDETINLLAQGCTNITNTPGTTSYNASCPRRVQLLPGDTINTIGGDYKVEVTAQPSAPVHRNTPVMGEWYRVQQDVVACYENDCHEIPSGTPVKLYSKEGWHVWAIVPQLTNQIGDPAGLIFDSRVAFANFDGSIHPIQCSVTRVLLHYDTTCTR